MRTLPDTQLFGERVASVQGSLSLDRFAYPIVKRMPLFRTPRRVIGWKTITCGAGQERHGGAGRPGPPPALKAPRQPDRGTVNLACCNRLRFGPYSRHRRCGAGDTDAGVAQW